jgi:hypothetical protein
VVLALEHLAGRRVGVAADLDAEPLGIAVVHLALLELAALHAQHLDPLDLLARPLAARLVVLGDAGMHAAAAADALADVQRVAHQHAGLRAGGVDRDLLAVFGGVAPLQPQARLGLLLVRHQAVVLLEVLGPLGRRVGVVGLGHQRRRAHQRGQAQRAAGLEEVAARGFQGIRRRIGGCRLHRAVGWSVLGRAGAGRLVIGHVFLQLGGKSRSGRLHGKFGPASCNGIEGEVLIAINRIR